MKYLILLSIASMVIMFVRSDNLPLSEFIEKFDGYIEELKKINTINLAKEVEKVFKKEHVPRKYILGKRRVKLKIPREEQVLEFWSLEKALQELKTIAKTTNKHREL